MNTTQTYPVGALEHDFYISHHIGNFIIPTDSYFSAGCLYDKRDNADDDPQCPGNIWATTGNVSLWIQQVCKVEIPLWVVEIGITGVFWLGQCHHEIISESWLAGEKYVCFTPRPAGLLDKTDSIFVIIYLLVGGLEHFLFFPKYWE
jgi:hypothetical protein